MGFHFKFQLRQPPLAQSPPSRFIQEKVLVPFEQVRGGAVIQNVSIIGAVDVDLAAHVKQAMAQKIAWLRAGAWEIYELALSIKR